MVTVAIRNYHNNDNDNDGIIYSIVGAENDRDGGRILGDALSDQV